MKFRDIEIEGMKEILADKEAYIKRLEEEKSNLRDYASNLDSENDELALEIEDLKKENRRLNEIINNKTD